METDSLVEKCRCCQSARSGEGYGEVPPPIGYDDRCDECEIAKAIRNDTVKGMISDIVGSLNKIGGDDVSPLKLYFPQRVIDQYRKLVPEEWREIDGKLYYGPYEVVVMPLLPVGEESQE